MSEPLPDVCLRCQVSNNPCGTDTIAVGRPCECRPCRLWARAFNEGREAGREEASRPDGEREAEVEAIASSVESMYWLFPRGDNRKDDVRSLAARIRALKGTQG